MVKTGTPHLRYLAHSTVFRAQFRKKFHNNRGKAS
ncbi:hypothetical protein G1C97_1123 [Bifidobacterium sp. DSM 109959]|uniref:Uncharacterized protein n=1 Tax=Bifidobacterium olomucense TaxID=2675324 RepID=A0A7Y0EXG9_9BIFI|nr:hypothetical protein [Bifidobacterium sp. DSM 109959]